MRRIGVLLALAAAALGAVTCDEAIELGPGAIVALRVGPDSALVPVGGSVQLVGAPLDSTGALITGSEIVWTSSNTSVATVDAGGSVSGAGVGSATITGTVEGIEGSATVLVDLAPAIVFSSDSIGFAAQAGGADPGPDSVGITNGGGFSLTGLTVEGITYGTGADSWLQAAVDSMTAPAILTLAPSTGGVTTAGTYTATVDIAATDASNSPGGLLVTLTIAPAAPATAAANDGDAQTAAAGAAVATPPSLLITDPFGNPVPGVAATFTVTAGGGSLTGATPTSDAAGVARVGSWTLGTGAGQNRVQGSAAGLSPVTFTATATAGTAQQIAVSAGDNQSALAGALVGVPPAVLVADQFGNGVAGVTVTFAVAGGGGSATGTSPVSDGQGIAAVGSWTLGVTPGANTLTATASGLSGSPITFTATGLTDAETIALDGGDAQTDTVGATLPVLYAVMVTDTGGAPVLGIPVSWTVPAGQGSITPSSTTDVNGIATATRVLGTTAGTQTAQAAVGGLTGSPVTFTATATAATATTIAVGAGNGQTATVNTAVATDPAALVSDQFGNPVSGHMVTFAVTGGGGTVDPVTAIATGASGLATVTSWTLGTAAGTNNNTLQATAAGGGIGGNPASFIASATAGSANAIAVFAGDGQTAVAGTAVPTDPAARVTDMFDNPVANVGVTFAPTAGGGSVTGASQTTNANGVATVTSWTVQAGGAMSTAGTFANTLTATASVGAAAFNASAIYSYATHVQPIWDASCIGCHGGVNGLFLNPPAAMSYANIVGVASACEPATDWIETGGGTAAENASIIMRLMDGGTCGTAGVMPTGGALSAATRDILRAWIRNGAPSN